MFAQLSVYIQKIEQTSSRLAITVILAELFDKLTPEEFEKTVCLCLGRLTPKYITLNFGMAEKMVIRAISMSLQIDIKEFTKEYKRIGDIGEVTHTFKKEHSTIF